MTRRVWLGAAASAPLISHSVAAADNAIRRMADTAGDFLASLTPEQKSRTMFGFSDEERFNFHFIPRDRKGLPFREMTGPQRHLATALLGAGLSTRGLVKASTIMSLEDVLRVLENDSGERRNTEKYYFSIFGNPAAERPWGYRIEGHHLSLNFTISNGPGFRKPLFLWGEPCRNSPGPPERSARSCRRRGPRPQPPWQPDICPARNRDHSGDGISGHHHRRIPKGCTPRHSGRASREPYDSEAA